MFSTAIIVFREIVEISLIISIMAASTQGIKHRNYYLLKGILLGILGAIILAFFTTKLDMLFDGYGQEIFAIINITAAIFLIGYTIIWMKKNSQELVTNIKLTSEDVINKVKPTSAIYLMIASAVFREGSEIVLFLNGLYVSNTQVHEIIEGFLLGLIAGISFGLLLYKGFLARLTYKYVFKVTSFLLTIFSAALASKLANFLTAANLINCLSTPIWDSSSLIKDSSFVGRALHLIIGYEASPTGLQVVFYFATFLLFYLIINYTNSTTTQQK